MIRKLHPSIRNGLWDVGVVMVVLVAAIVSIGAFFHSVDPAATLENNWDFAGLYAEGQNPWAHDFVSSDAHADAAPVRTAATQPHAKTPALR